MKLTANKPTKLRLKKTQKPSQELQKKRVDYLCKYINSPAQLTQYTRFCVSIDWNENTVNSVRAIHTPCATGLIFSFSNQFLSMFYSIFYRFSSAQSVMFWFYGPFTFDTQRMHCYCYCFV